MSNLVLLITTLGYWFLLILSPIGTFEGSLSPNICHLSANCIFLAVLCKKTNLSPFFRGPEEAGFIIKVTLTGYVSSWQLGKILLSVSHMKDPSFSHLSASQETFWPSQTEKKKFPGMLENSDMFKMKSHWRRIYQTQSHCWGLYFFKEDILSCVASQERRTALADFSVEFLLSSYLFFRNWLYIWRKRYSPKKMELSPNPVL